MNQCFRIIVGLLLLVCDFAYSQNSGSPFSPIDIEVNTNGSILAIAGKTANTIAFINMKNGSKLGEVKTELPPTGLVYNKSDLWVTTSHSQGYLLKINKKGQLKSKIRVGHGACAPVIHPLKPLIYVANQYSNDVSVVDAKSLKEILRIPVLSQPMAQTISPDGKYLFVANLLPNSRADIDIVAASVSIIDTEKGEKIKDIQLANGSNALRDIKVSPDGRFVFTTHNLGRFLMPTTQLELGWMNTSAISIIEIENLNYVATVLLDEPERGAAGSWGIDFSDDNIFVAHSGTHDYSKISYKRFIDKLLRHPNKEELSYDLTFLKDIRKRYPVKGNGPRDILVVQNKLLLANYFSDAIEIINLNEEQFQFNQIELNKGYSPDAIRAGEMIFNDATNCFQSWQSCNGCHPNDARVDGLNWDLLNDGTGNPKNCKSLLFSHETGPAMITGIRPSAEVAVRAGFKYIQFAKIDEEEVKKVDEYLKSLRPVPSPKLNEDGSLSMNAKKGKLVFDKATCVNCHKGNYFTDNKMHTMGEKGRFDFQNSWDTPTLIEVWRTPPYLHDGRSATLDDVFEKEKHGLKNQQLTRTEVEWLVEYVKSL